MERIISIVVIVIIIKNDDVWYGDVNDDGPYISTAITASLYFLLFATAASAPTTNICYTIILHTAYASYC